MLCICPLQDPARRITIWRPGNLYSDARRHLYVHSKWHEERFVSVPLSNLPPQGLNIAYDVVQNTLSPLPNAKDVSYH